MSRILKVAAALAGTALLAGCTTHAAPPISAKQLAYARTFRLYTVYWAGRKVGGVRLTETDGPDDYDPAIGITMYYGNCDHGHGLLSDGCTLPLKVTTVLYVPHSNTSLGKRRDVRLRGVPAVIFDGGREIELYTDQTSVDVVADTPQRALQAVAHLTPFNRRASAAWPAFPKPEFQPGVSGKELSLRSAAAGVTGSTVQPPAELQPAIGST